jgi:DNA-binding transcriptional MerR regulator
MAKAYSTAQVARKIGIHRVTLQLWLTEGKVQPSKIVKLNGGKIYLWTAADVEKVRRYKAEHYWRGRGGHHPRKKKGP